MSIYMKTKLFAVSVLLACAVLSGCKTGYQWTSKVPEDLRTISVPTFRNESGVTELGAVATRQLLREFQREGTFKIRHVGDAAVEVQGVLEKSGLNYLGGDRRGGERFNNYSFTVEAKVTVVDKKHGRVLIDNKPYRATTSLLATQDVGTAKRDASGRLADDLARQIVDDVLAMPW